MANSPPPLEVLLEALRTSPGQVARNPKAAIEAGLAQLRRVRFPDPRPGAGRVHDRVVGMAEYRIDDLARAADMTTRNVRAYQDRRLLHAPRRSGRVALYDDSHLSRLKLIGSMLQRGYTTAHISEMLTAWEHGKDLADVLGVEEVLISPWGDDLPKAMPLKDVRALAGDKASFDRLVSLGVIRVQGTKATVSRPALLEGCAEMSDLGMPMERLLDLHAGIQTPVDEIADQLVVAAARHFATVKGPAWVPDANELTELTTVLARFRQLAMTSVIGTLAASMERSVEGVLAAYLEHLSQPSPQPTSDQQALHVG